MSAESPIFCVNHPQTETLLRCNKCGRPFCIKCLQRVPVGYRCRACLNIQQAGYYTATPGDYVLTALVSIVAASIAGVIGAAISGFWIFMVFYAPIAGGALAEIVRRVIEKRRGRYIWLIACLMFSVGAFAGAGLVPLFSVFAGGGGTAADFLAVLLLFPMMAARALFNIGLWIYLVVGISTIYARLRS